jgi:L-alanine-DL-glutamate epimerase-like enolase superfamily enzyme
MEISDLELYAPEIRSHRTQRPVRSLLVRLIGEGGLEGWGESTVDWQGPQLSGRCDPLALALVGRSVFDVEELHTLEVISRSPLRSGVEMACFDMMGRLVGQPLCRLLGGRYRERIPVAVRLPEGGPQNATQAARELADQGFHWQIVTSTGQMDQDVRLLAAVRESLGDRAELRLDAAGGYDLRTARDLCAALEYEGLQFLLDPLDTSQLHPHASLGRQTSVPIAVGRPIHGPRDVLAAIRCGAASFVVVDVGRVGGVVPARKCAAVADAGGVPALLAAGPSLGIATAAMLQLAAATPHFSGCNQCAYHQFHDDVLTEPLEVADGMMVVPQGPGLGVAVDRARIDRYQVT